MGSLLGDTEASGAGVPDALDLRVPTAARPVLRTLLTELERRLPGLVDGFYVYGSIAYGAFEAEASDIDCLAVTCRPCDLRDLTELRLMHEEIAARWPDCDLEVSYVESTELGPRGTDSRPQPLFREGVFDDAAHVELNSPLWSSILWWQIKRRGVALRGPEPAALGFNVTEERLLEDNRRLVEIYWKDWGRSPALILKLRYRRAVEWVVLGMLRSYFTLCEADVTTKPGAAEYGIARLPPRWHRIIRETLAGRHHRDNGGQLFRLRRAWETVLFARFMVGECRRAAARRGLASGLGR